MNDEVTEEVEAQPNGERIETTLDVMPGILTSLEFAEEVRKVNGFPEGLDQKDIAIMFLTGRFQWATTLMSQRTDHLARQVDGLLREAAAHEDSDREEGG